MGLEKGNKCLVVKEPNLFIEAIHQLSKAEQVIWFYALTKTKFFRYGDPDKELTEEDIEEMKKQRISISAYTVMDLNELRREFRDYFEANDIAYYRKVLERMGAKNLFKVNTDHYIKTMEELGYGYMVEGLKYFKENKEIDYHAISTISQVILAKDGTLAIVFSPDVAPILLELKKRYTLYDFETILKLKSKYSRILYRLLKEKLGLKQTNFKISVEELQNILNTKKAYRNYIHLFNSKILQPAIKEINEKTDIKVGVEAIRQSRGGKIVAFEFKIREIPKLPEIKDIIDLEKLRDILSLIEIDGENENELSEFQDLGIEIEQKDEENTEEFKIEKRAYRLLSLKRLNPAVAIWYLLHFPKEKHKEIWLELTKIDLNKEIKYPEKFLEKQIENRDKGWDFLLKEQTQKLIVDSLKELAKPYVEYLRDRQRRREIESITKEIKEIGLNLSTDEKLKVKKKIEEEFNWNGRVTDLVKKLYIKKDLEGLKRILEIFQSIYVDNLFEDFGF